MFTNQFKVKGKTCTLIFGTDPTVPTKVIAVGINEAVFYLNPNDEISIGKKLINEFLQ